MPIPGWLHVNGVSIQSEVHKDALGNALSSDQHSDEFGYSSSTNLVQYNSYANDGQLASRQVQRFEYTDLPKKIFLDRQIKKAKASPGIIKGTALSRQTSLHSASSSKINSSSSTENLHQDDLKAASVDELSSGRHSASTQQQAERSHEPRRPRVYFADVNRVQFFENNQPDDDNEKELFNAKLRRSRNRGNKKNMPLVVNNPITPPSIQQSQSLYTPYSSFSRQLANQDSSVRKTTFNVSPRIQSSRVTHLPEILNQSMTHESSIKERYVLQREKPILRLPEPIGDQSMNSSSAEVSRESNRPIGLRANASLDSSIRFDPDDYQSMNNLHNTSFSNSMSPSRQRPSLSTISLRHHFFLSSKPKSINPRRSASMKSSVMRLSSTDEENSLNSNQHEPVIVSEMRPMTGSNLNKKTNRNYMIHFNTKTQFNPYKLNETNDLPPTNSKSTPVHESSQDRFPRSSFLNNSSFPEPSKRNPDGSLRSARTSSTRRSNEFQVTSNTIIV